MAVSADVCSLSIPGRHGGGLYPLAALAAPSAAPDFHFVEFTGGAGRWPRATGSSPSAHITPLAGELNPPRFTLISVLTRARRAAATTTGDRPARSARAGGVRLAGVGAFRFSSPSGLAGPAAHETLLLCGCVVGIEVGILLVRLSPRFSWTWGSWSTSDCRHGPSSVPEHAS